MIYNFKDRNGTFTVKDPWRYNLYFPLTNQKGSLLSSISPNLSGDIKQDNDHFLTPPASVEDLRSNLLCRREFFVKLNGKKTLRLSSPGNDTLEAGLLYHKITKNISGLCVEITNFIPYDMDCEVMHIRIKNTSLKPVKITPVSFIPLYGRREKNIRDHRHVSSLLNRIKLLKYGILLTPTMVFDEKGHLQNQTSYYAFGYEGKTIPPSGQFPTLESFLGEGEAFTPEAVEKNRKPFNKKLPEFDGKEACAGFRFRDKCLKKNETADYFLILGISKNQQEAPKAMGMLDAPDKIYRRLEETKKFWQNYLKNLNFDFGNNAFSGWLMWVKFQPVLRKLFGCSFLPHFDYGKGGRGWRDLWQDALTLILTEPARAKELIVNNFHGVRLDGSNAAIITKENGFASDRNKINRVWMDHGVWPYLTLRSYINRSGDLGVLLREIPYFKDHLIKRAKEIDSSSHGNDCVLRDKNGKIYQASVLEHVLLQNIIPFFNVGSHNVIKLENADWNDGLDMASQAGESVAFSFMYGHNLLDICFFLEKLKETSPRLSLSKEIIILLDTAGEPVNYCDFKEKLARLDKYWEAIKNFSGEKEEISIDSLVNDLKTKSRHIFTWLTDKEWLEEGFFNGYYDNKSLRVEGGSGKNTKMTLTGQVFAIMSGGADKTQVAKAWVSIKKYLRDKKLGGFRLNTDFGGIYMDLGRAFGFSYGDKENGAFFNHMVIMLANGLYKRGFIEEGYEVMSSIYKMASGCGKIYPMIPEYFNGQGKGLYFYLTGSASWYIYTLTEEILGVKFILGDLLLEPKLLGKNFLTGEIGFSFDLSGVKYNFIFQKTGTNKGFLGIKEVIFQGNKIPIQTRTCLIKKELLNNQTSKELSFRVTLE